MKFAPYRRYSTSNVEWAGPIPAGWRTARLRHIGQVNPPASEANRLSSDAPVSFFPMEAVGDDGTVDLSRERPLGEIQGSYSYFRNGDVAIAKVTPCFENGKGAVMSGLANSIGFGSSELTNVRLVCDLDPRLFFYFTRTPEVRGLGAASMYGAGGLKRIPDDFFRDFKVPIPSSEEQASIIAFLDLETAKLDTLIAKQQHLIDLLQEKRQAVISHAVTKGLDPKAPTKDSGVEWLGNVPAHWEVKQLGLLLERITYGFTNPMPVTDDGPYMLTANDIGDGEVLFESARRTALSAFLNAITDKSRPKRGDVLVTKDGTLGRVALIAGDEPACINQSVALLRPDRRKLNGKFAGLALRGGPYQHRILFDAGGTTIKHIYITRLAKMPLAVPPIEEQSRIEEWLEERLRHLATVIDKCERSVALMGEHRSALISAAVTGKIDVRGYAELRRDAAPVAP